MAQLNYKPLGFPDPFKMNDAQINNYLATPEQTTLKRMPGQSYDPANYTLQDWMLNSGAKNFGITGQKTNQNYRPGAHTSLQNNLIKALYPNAQLSQPRPMPTITGIRGGKSNNPPYDKNAWRSQYPITKELLSSVPTNNLKKMIHDAAMINYKERNDGGGPLGGMISPASVLGAGLGFVGAPLALKAAAGAVGNLAGAGGSAPGGSAPGGAGFQASAQRSPIPQNRGATPFNRGLPNLGASPNTGILGRRR